MTDLKDRAKKLGFKAIPNNWQEYKDQPWLSPLLVAEEAERDKRSLERRIREARIGQFKPMTEFDWQWPQMVDREAVEELFTLNFLKEKTNVVLIGTNGLGKTMIAQNLAY